MYIEVEVAIPKVWWFLYDFPVSSICNSLGRDCCSVQTKEIAQLARRKQ